jgi:hypothetical protein
VNRWNVKFTSLASAQIAWEQAQEAREAAERKLAVAEAALTRMSKQWSLAVLDGYREGYRDAMTDKAASPPPAQVEDK